MAPIDDEAAEWAARIDAAPLDDENRTGLQTWLEQDVRHRGALLRAQAMLCLIDEISGPSGAADARDTPARVEALGQSGGGRWWRRAAGMSAAACAAALAMFLMLRPDAGHYATETGEVRRVAMEDGSRAVINTESRLNTAIGEKERLVVLSSGEAWFQVAKDPERPFIVEAGTIRVRATGTAFSVRRMPDAVTVVVTEGSVEVWNEAAPTLRTAARAGQSATVATDVPVAPSLKPAREEALAWRDGDIVLEGTSVAEAADEFNRYNLRKIRIGNAAIGRETMIGYFKINQPEQFAHAAATISNADIRYDGNNIVIE